MIFALIRWLRSSYHEHGSVCDTCGHRSQFPIWPRCPECGNWSISYRPWRAEEYEVRQKPIGAQLFVESVRAEEE